MTGVPVYAGALTVMLAMPAPSTATSTSFVFVLSFSSGTVNLTVPPEMLVEPCFGDAVRVISPSSNGAALSIVRFVVVSRSADVDALSTFETIPFAGSSYLPIGSIRAL